MDYEWDPAKAARNVVKHGIDFAEAILALEDDFALTIRDVSAEGEERWVTLGIDARARLLVVVYTWRGHRIRVISARPATPGERQEYEGKA